MTIMEWFAKSPIAAAFRVFIAVVLAMLAADWTDGGSISFDRWQTWVIAGVAACVPALRHSFGGDFPCAG